MDSPVTLKIGKANELCPSCGADFDGGPIPESIRENYSPPYRWSRKIGIVCPHRDRLVSWQCPDCGHQWERTAATEWLGRSG